MVTDDWDGSRNDEHEVEFPTIRQVEQAIQRMNGERFSLVTLMGPGEAHIAIGGGGGGRYVVYASFDNERFHSLLADSESEQMVTLFVGGQEGEYPLRTIVDRLAALAAAKTFAECGELDPRFSWGKH